jgi:DNA-binding GntR family transcriptional regulator
VPDYRTEYQKVYEVVRNAILAGEFKPGERLPQRKLAKKFETTTITVREALRFLENDNLVVIEPRWGGTVVEMTPERLHGRYVVREALEGMAARLAGGSMTAEEKQRLRELATHCDSELLSDRLTPQQKASLHYSLHNLIVQMTRCDELIRSVNRNSLYTILLSNAYHIDWTHDDPHRHRNLVEIIISGTADEAEDAMRAHVRDGYSMELQALQGAPKTSFGTEPGRSAAGDLHSSLIPEKSASMSANPGSTR